MRKPGVVMLIFLVGLICQSCSDRSIEPTPFIVSPEPDPGNITVTEKSLLESTNRFGLKLFKKINADEKPDVNIFISPLSVSFALGMTYNGAAGETQKAMASTLEYSGLSIEEINHSYRNVIDILSQLDPNVVFDIANSIWYREGLPISPEFIDVNRTYFDAEVRGMDFSQAWAVDTINHWVDINTRGKITDIIKPPIPPQIVMYLINALYFNGNWTLPFDTGSTTDMPFQLWDGTIVERPMMQTDTFFNYFDNELFQAVDLPYGDKSYSMTVLLPGFGHTVDDIIEQMSDESWAAWMGNMVESEVILGLPKFKFGYEVMLNETLKAMGMAIAFDQYAADFRNMVTDMSLLMGNLYIDIVKHKTFIQVDEVGTEAAAVTAVGISLTSVGPPIMYANRPFLFVIHEHATGSILFMGKVVDPVWE